MPLATIWSMPALMVPASYDHVTRVVALSEKDTTEKRAVSTPRANWFTSSLAKAFSPLGPSIEPPLSLGFCIEPLSSSTRMKSIGVAQGGLGDGGEGGAGGGGPGEGGGAGGGDGGGAGQ